MQLPLASVDRFFPVSERGSQLLTSDVKQLGMKLSEPIFERLWINWLSNRDEHQAFRRGIRLLSALQLENFLKNDRQHPFSDLHTPVREILERRVVPVANHRIKRLEGTRAYPWAAAFSVFGEIVGEEIKSEAIEQFKLNGILGKLKSDMSFEDSVFRKELYPNSEFHNVLSGLSSIIENNLGSNISMHFLVTSFHYQHLVSLERKVDPFPLLISDLRSIKNSINPILGKRIAAMVAYFVGRGLSDEAITRLVIANDSKSYQASVLPKLPFDIDLDATTQAVKETQIKNRDSEPQDKSRKNNDDSESGKPKQINKPVNANSNSGNFGTPDPKPSPTIDNIGSDEPARGSKKDSIKVDQSGNRRKSKPRSKPNDQTPDNSKPKELFDCSDDNSTPPEKSQSEENDPTGQQSEIQQTSPKTEQVAVGSEVETSTIDNTKSGSGSPNSSEKGADLNSVSQQGAETERQSNRAKNSDTTASARTRGSQNRGTPANRKASSRKAKKT